MELRGGYIIHELPLTQKILEIAIRYAEENKVIKIVGVCLRVGEVRDFVEDITQKYWDYLSKGTIAEGAKIKLEKVPVSAICHKCKYVFHFDWRAIDKLLCPTCESCDVEMLNVNELEVKEISIIT